MCRECAVSVPDGLMDGLRRPVDVGAGKAVVSGTFKLELQTVASHLKWALGTKPESSAKGITESS